MKKDSFAAGFCIIALVVIVLYIIGAVGSANEPKCIKSGCDNKQASGSSYCYLHKPYKSNNDYSNNSDNSYSHSATTETTKSKYNNTLSGSTVSATTESSYKHSSLSTSSPYKSYDDGYDAIYDDDDYDWDRYNSDPDYADGVDDAMDEMGDDW